MIFAIRQLKAFTLIELILVVVILSVLSTLAVPRLAHFYDTLQLRGFTSDLSSLAQYLQAEAISRAGVYSLTYDEEHAFFRARLKVDDEFRDISGRWGRKFLIPPGITVSGQPPEVSEILFYPDGSSDTATIYFENKYGARISLSIQGSTGQIKVH